MTSPPAQKSKSSTAVTLTVIGIVSVMVVGYCAAQSEDDVTADCIDTSTQQPDGSYAVVDDFYCNDDDDGSSSSSYHSSYGAYRWYYGGSRVGTRVRSGSTFRPSDVSISSRGGHEIQRGGFGGRWGGGS
ncbi:hypothetical protein OIE66_09020 [Nonomuraea sp. NBC_01738]|uniref:hypothetical protein n=1 Tax=Nonomuraea sp. NBC_01738 TaxID=2976003 RepID=UPI002E10A89E|nr:hypothetical protein OIE66_09020 [Nonomuraea sp. NBC_01738]